MKATEYEQLHHLVEACRPYSEKGEVAQYIPELAKSRRDALGITIQPLERQSVSVGDCHEKFTLQSISKVISLLLALIDCGEKEVFEKVGKEPTGDVYNSMLKLETIAPGKPFNPLINAGAIAVSSLIKGRTKEEKASRVLQFVRRLCNDESIVWDDAVFVSEAHTSSRNRALAYLLEENGIIENGVEEPLYVYFKQCSIEVTCTHLAAMAAILANDGIDPDSEMILIPRRYVQIAKTLMFTCGMYNASGAFAIDAGIPAKSGVSGGIMALVPGRMGIGVIGPALDDKGNSVAGIHLLQELSSKWNLHMF